MLTLVSAVLQIVGMYVNVQTHTSAHFQMLAFDFLLGKVPGGKEAQDGISALFLQH